MTARGSRHGPGGCVLALATLAGLAASSVAHANTFVVTSTAATGPGSLNQALLDANAAAGADTVIFRLPGPCAASAPCTIALQGALPAVTDVVTIDGTTQAGYAGQPVVVLDGALAGTGTNGLVLRAANSTVRGLEIASFGRHGVSVEAAATIAGNVIRRNAGRGIVVGWNVPGAVIEGNWIGVGPGGAAGEGNREHGIEVGGSGTRIGGTTAAARNVISGNGWAGINVVGTGVVIQGNYVGTDPSGTHARPNGNGVMLHQARSTLLGGTAAGARNVISGNAGHGVVVTGDVAGTQILGNHVGVDANGTAALGNGANGILQNAGAGLVIGGATAGARNVVSGNGQHGIHLLGTGTRVQGNHVGTNAAGSAALANRDDGIRVTGPDGREAMLGGTNAGEGNVVSGNQGDGIRLTAGANGVAIRGNRVGTNADGTAAVANGGAGVYVENSAGAIVGGAGTGARNLLSGNRQQGVMLFGAQTTGTIVQGNWIGPNATNSGTIANGISGISVTNRPSDVRIGGGSTALGNVIRGNGGAGIGFDPGLGAPARIRIGANSISGNGQLGIRHGDQPNPVPNDGLRRDDQSNRGMDHPVFTTVNVNAGEVHVAGHVGSAPGQATFAGAHVEVYVADGDPSGFGEGQLYVGATIADGAGNFAASFAFAQAAVGTRFTGSATDAEGNTSEFGPQATAVQGSVPPRGPIGEWRFEEAGWSGAPGEVRDSTANGFNLTASAGATTGSASGATPSCRHGVFAGGQQRVEIAHDPRLAPTNALTISAWIWPDAMPSEWMSIAGKDITSEIHLTPGGDIAWWWGGGNRELTTSGAGVRARTWTHVVVTYAQGAQRIYVDGTLRGSRAESGQLSVNAAPFMIGADVDSGSLGVLQGRTWRGRIDNVRFYDRALSAAEVAALASETRPCDANAVAGLVVATSRHGLYCLDHAVTVTAVDGAGNPVGNYTGLVTLQASTLRGSWLLQSGAGAFADPLADDGLATYRFPGNQASASFLLRYRQGPQVVDVDAFQVDALGIRDDDREGTILFSPTGFTMTSQPIALPIGSVPPFTPVVTAGAAVPVYLTAYGQTPDDPQCGVLEGYTGAKSLKFWTTRVDPAGGTRVPTVNGAAVALAEASSTAQAVAFVAGQALVTWRYRDVGRVALGVKDDGTGNPQLPDGIRGGTGHFVSRPATLVVTDLRRTADGAPNPGAASAAGAVFVAAGRPFSATVTALDAEGDPTPNFGRESAPESVRLDAAVLLPLGGASPPVSGTFGAFANGQATGTGFAWPEVGIVNLVPRVADGSYLGASDVVGTPAGPVGRFVPDRFEVALNTPVFQTGCNAGGFTYVGQPFGYAVPPVATVTAVSAGGTPTTNYRGTLFRLANATLGARAYSASGGTLDLSRLPAATADPAIADLGGGVATLSFGAGAGLAYARGAPVAPFQAAISLAFEVIDADGVRAPGTPTFGASGGIPFSAGALQRYGRVLLRNAAGSELLDLPVPMTTQYWLDAARGFTTHLADACTPAPTLALSNWRRNLGPGETCARDGGSPGTSGIGCAVAAPPAQRLRAVATGGDFGLRLAAPGAGNSGAVTIEATVPAWLRFDWNAALPGLENPSALATFGVFTGPASRIYRREVW